MIAVRGKVTIVNCKREHVDFIVSLLCKEIAKRHYATHGEILDGTADMAFRITKNARAIQQRLVGQMLGSKNARIFVAVVNGRPVGFSIGMIHDWQGKKVAYSADSVVQKSWRGRGVYSKLVRARERYYKRSGAVYDYFYVNPRNKLEVDISKHRKYSVASIVMLKKFGKRA